ELTPVRRDLVNAPGVRLARGEPHSPNIPGGSSASSENVAQMRRDRSDLHAMEMPACVSVSVETEIKRRARFSSGTLDCFEMLETR
ncbi:hypothetical protein M9458_033656, partial [Cirrhinus mrigala]